MRFATITFFVCAAIADVVALGRVRRRDLLGGLIHDYQLAA
jgi:hypothetical protein